MTLIYTHHQNGISIPNIHLPPTTVQKTQQCFQVSGEQNEIHLYLTEIGKLGGGFINDLTLVYNIDSGGRTLSNGKHIDANVSIYFFEYRLVPTAVETFQDLFIDPFIGIYF